MTTSAVVPSNRVGFLATQLLQENPSARPKASKAVKLIRSNNDIAVQNDASNWGLEYVLSPVLKESLSEIAPVVLSRKCVLVSVILKEVHGPKKMVDAPMEMSENDANADDPVFILAPGRKYQVLITLGLGYEAANQLAKIRRITMRTRDGKTSLLEPEPAGRIMTTLKIRAIWDLASHGGTLKANTQAEAGTRLGLQACVHCEQVDGTRLRMETDMQTKVWFPGKLDPGKPFIRDQHAWSDVPAWLLENASGAVNVFKFLTHSGDTEEDEGGLRRAAPRFTNAMV